MDEKAISSAEFDLDIVRSKLRQIASENQRYKDAMLMQVISAHLGRSDWVLDELQGRCECKVRNAAFPDAKTETYCVDGVDLITFHQPQSDTVKDGMSWLVHTEIKYMLHIECDIDMSKVRQ